ncbi:MAG TPA: MFS transporter, partial [Propionibacteriaceae bacterium]|nr:MFS transporter [Propionibacteriaceae bacterium]
MAEPMGRRFWTVWLASSASYLAEGLIFGALPVLAASLTLDARLISVTDAVHQTGWLLLGLVSGVAADMIPRLRIMWLANAVRALTAGGFGLLVAAGHASLPLVYVLGFLLGLAAPFFDNASASVLPELVPSAQFQRANSLTQVALAVGGNLIGPVAGTGLFVLAPGAPFGLAGVAYAAGMLVTLWLARREPVPVRPDGAPRPMVLLREGLSYLSRHRVLRTLAGAVAVVNLVTAGAVAVAVLYVLQRLHLPKSTYGLVMASFALGAILGGVLTVRLTRRVGERTSVLAALVAFGVSMVVLGASTSVALSVGAMMLMGFFSMVWNITVNSYRQREVPLALLGRVTSVFRMVAFVTMPVGALLAGIGTHALGLPWTYVVGGLLLFVTAATALKPLLDM